MALKGKVEFRGFKYDAYVRVTHIGSEVASYEESVTKDGIPIKYVKVNVILSFFRYGEQDEPGSKPMEIRQENVKVRKDVNENILNRVYKELHLKPEYIDLKDI
jgi:hypothetical protein